MRSGWINLSPSFATFELRYLRTISLEARTKNLSFFLPSDILTATGNCFAFSFDFLEILILLAQLNCILEVNSTFLQSGILEEALLFRFFLAIRIGLLSWKHFRSPVWFQGWEEIWYREVGRSKNSILHEKFRTAQFSFRKFLLYTLLSLHSHLERTFPWLESKSFLKTLDLSCCYSP